MGDPVVPTPSQDQEALESKIFGKLGYLHSDAPFDLAGEKQFLIRRILPTRNGLTLDMEHAVRGACALAEADLLPGWEDGDDDISHGIRGLRARLHRDEREIQFRRIGQPGCVVFRNVDVDEFVRVRHTYYAAGYRTADHLDTLTTQETCPSWTSRTSPLPSVLIRRFGILRTLGADWIDSWFNTADRFSVELSVDRSVYARTDKLLEMMTSSWLEPRLVHGKHVQYGDYHLPLFIAGTEQELDLRLAVRD